MDANAEENPSPSGAERQHSEPQPSLAEVLSALSQAMGVQTQLLTMLVSQQQAIIEMMSPDDEQDDEGDEPAFDMEGNPIRANQ